MEKGIVKKRSKTLRRFGCGELIPKITEEQKYDIIEILEYGNNLLDVMYYLEIDDVACRLKIDKSVECQYDQMFVDASKEGNLRFKRKVINSMQAAAEEEGKKFEFWRITAEKSNAWSTYSSPFSHNDTDIIDYGSEKPYESLNKIINGVGNNRIDGRSAMFMSQLIKDSYAVKEVEDA